MVGVLYYLSWVALIFYVGEDANNIILTTQCIVDATTLEYLKGIIHLNM